MSIQAFAYVIEHCEAQHGARCMMVAIANHCDERGENCWASVATLAHEARLSRRGAQEALAQLREEGEIEAMGASRGNTTVYRIVGMSDNLDQVTLMGSADPAPPLSGSAETAQGGAHFSTQGGAESAHKPSLTVSGTTTPPNPPRGELSRRRDREQLRNERVAWATEHFPDFGDRVVLHAMSMAETRPGAEMTVDTVRAELDRMAAEPLEEKPA